MDYLTESEIGDVHDEPAGETTRGWEVHKPANLFVRNQHNKLQANRITHLNTVLDPLEIAMKDNKVKQD